MRLISVRRQDIDQKYLLAMFHNRRAWHLCLFPRGTMQRPAATGTLTRGKSLPFQSRMARSPVTRSHGRHFEEELGNSRQRKRGRFKTCAALLRASTRAVLALVKDDRVILSQRGSNIFTLVVTLKATSSGAQNLQI